jgi:outer membrane protein assembly complex protein YaeT
MMACAGYAVYPTVVFCLIVSPSVLPGDVTTYEGKTIGRILFLPREQPVDPEELYHILPVREGTPLRLDTVRAAIERLFATGSYSDIQVDAQLSGDKVVLRFVTQNNWFIGRVAVTGRVRSPPNNGQLANASRLTLGDLHTDEKVHEGVDGIQQLFRSNGYYLSQVAPRFSYDPHTNQVDVDFAIESGRRARYASPRLVGDLKMPANQVISATRWKGWFGWHQVTQSRTERGLAGVRNKYQKQNRLMARVTLEKMDFDEDSMRVRPTLNIRAGPKVEISTVGAKVSRSKLRRFVPVFEERSVDRDLLVEGQRNLRDFFQSEGYFSAEVEFKSQRTVNDKEVIDYIINLGKRHKLVKVTIEGNRYFDTQTIRERMYLLPSSLQFRRGRFSESYLRRDEQTITNLYEQNGFRDVKVTSTVDDRDVGKEGRISVVIHIDEGPQWTVATLEVDGIEQLNKNEILSRLSSTAGQPFSEFNVAVDRDNILSQYFSEGFPNATFEWSSTPAGPQQVNLRYVISEGQRRFVRQVITNGLVTTRPRLVNRNISLNPGDPLSQPKMIDTQRRLYDLGIFSQVNVAIQNPDGDLQNKFVIYQLDEAKKYSIATGVGAQIGRIGGGTNLDAPAGTTGFSPRVSFDISRLNFRGLGQTVSFRSRLSNIEKLALVSYIIPRLYDRQNLTLTFTALYDDTTNIHTFDAKRAEGSVQLSQKLSKADTILYRFTYRHTSVSSLVIDPLLVPLYSQPVRVGLLGVSYIQDRRDDPTNSHKGMFNTVDVALASSVFGSQTGFTRFLGRNSTYHPIGKKLVLARSITFGWLNPITRLPGSPDIQPGDIFSGVALEQIPIAERFFSGGGTSMRAFPENQAGPRDSATGFPVGGQALLFFNTELRFPLIGDNIGGVLFWDAGNVYTRVQDISFRYGQAHQTILVNTNGTLVPQQLFGFNYMPHAFGFGIRYRTPIGPVRLDLAFSPNSTHFAGCAGYSGTELLLCGLYNPDGTPVLPRKNDQISPFQFHFSIGQAF